jgi:sugar/nucleoside kinase (ribokinase family)
VKTPGANGRTDNPAPPAGAFDLACLGNLVADVFGKAIDRFPEKGGSELFDEMEIHAGGCAHNTGVAAARLGMKVAVLGKLGTDSFGDMLAGSLCKAGVNMDGVRRSGEASTAFSFIMVPRDGQRRIYHTVGVSRAFVPADVSRDLIARARVLHVAGAACLPGLDGAPTVELLRFARSRGIVTSLDPTVRPGIAGLIVPCLPHLDVFLPNSDEAVCFTGLTDPADQLKFCLDQGAGTVGIKRGPDGCLVSDGRTTVSLGVYDVPVADTCGAGDAFVAGFLYGKIRNWDLERCARFATATAAFCVQAIGTTTAIPPAERILEFMERNVLKETKEYRS